MSGRGDGGGVLVTTREFITRVGGCATGPLPRTGASAWRVGVIPGPTTDGALRIRSRSAPRRPACATERPLANASCGMAVIAFGAAMFTNLWLTTRFWITLLFT